MSSSDGDSWALDIQKYCASKVTLPWQPQDQHPVKHVTKFEKSREEREYDPILGKFRNSYKEQAKSNEDSKKLSASLQNGRAKELRSVHHFNLINHSPMYRGATDQGEKSPAVKQRRSAAAYDIVTNQPLVASSEGSSVLTLSDQHKSESKRPTIAFNILTNTYHERHDERAEQEKKNAKAAAAVKFYETHDYNLIEVRYYDEDKEAKFLKHHSHKEQTHGNDFIKRLPPTEQSSEGRVYDIINHDMIDESKIHKVTSKEQRALNKMQKAKFEARMREYGETQRTKADEMCLNRFDHARHAASYVHGYDPISHQPFVGRNSKTIIPTRTRTALPLWRVLEGQLGSARIISSSMNGSPTSVSKSNVLVIQHAIPKTSIAVQPPSLAIECTPGNPVRSGGFVQE